METQAAGLQASAGFTAKFWTFLRHFYGWKECRLLGIVFDCFCSFWYGNVYFILENRVRGVDKQNCCAIMWHQNCSVTVKKTFPHMLANLKLSEENIIYLYQLCCVCVVFLPFSNFFWARFWASNCCWKDDKTSFRSRATHEDNARSRGWVVVFVIFFSLLLHKTSYSVYVNRVRDT